MPSWDKLKESTKTWLLATLVFVVYIAIAVLVVWLLKVHGARMWWIIGGLTVLGLASAGLLLWFLRRRPNTGASVARGERRRDAGRRTRAARDVEAHWRHAEFRRAAGSARRRSLGRHEDDEHRALRARPGAARRRCVPR